MTDACTNSSTAASLATNSHPERPAAERVRSAALDDFDTFYRAHHARIERALILTLGSPDLGQDATAEAFTRALDRWADVQRYENPRGWLYRVGVNWAHSRWRRRRREVGPDDWAELGRGGHRTDHDVDLVSDGHVIVEETHRHPQPRRSLLQRIQVSALRG